jgi:phenylalanyl-tRNA synthetase alpha chain
LELGSRHPINLVKGRIIEIFKSIGFAVSDGPEIEDDWHNFTALNLPEYHPARDMQDTFFIEQNPDVLLRTHTSSVQIRIWKKINRQLEFFLREEFSVTKLFLLVHTVFSTK